MKSENRRSFVKKSLTTTAALTFTGLIRAHGDGGGGDDSTTEETTIETTEGTTVGVLITVSKTQTYWGNYTVTSYRTNPTAQQLMDDNWEMLYGNSGTEDPEDYAAGPESLYVSVNYLLSITPTPGSTLPTVTQTGSNTFVLSFSNTSLKIKRQIKDLAP